MDKLESGQKLATASYSVILFDKEDRIEESERILKSIYRNNGWLLQTDRYIHLGNFLSALPFILSNGLTKDYYNKLERSKTMVSWTCANLLPLHGEYKGVNSAVLQLLGRRGQPLYWDPFSNTGGNYNVAVIGKSGSGISFLLIYNLLFVPKVDVIITDPINQIRTDRKIDNIPFGLGFMAHTISSLGNWMTDIFGMNFTLPNDLQYNKNGMLLGSKIINDTLNARITDDKTNSNINNYIRQCIIPAITLKKIKIEDYLKSASIQEFLKFGKNGVLAYTYTNTNNIRTITLCNNITELQKDFNIEINKLIQKQNNKFNNGNNIGNTIDINNINQYILGIQANITKIFEQNLIANAINYSTQDYLSIVGADAGAINYAITKDNLQRKQNSILQWIQANTFLPLLKIIIEVIFYSLFPLVILLALLPNGFKLIKNYFLILLTLQLWSPLYAILNLIMTLEQKYRLTNLLGQTEEIISLYNRQAIIDITQGIQMQAGLLAFMIPSISFKITQGMQSFGEGLASGIVSSNTCTTGNLVGEISSGNLSYGNGSFKNIVYSNTNANKHDTNYTDFSGIKRKQNSDGITTITTDFGTVYDTTANRNNTGVTANFSESLENGLHRAVADAEVISKNRANTLNDTITRLNSSYRENNDTATSWEITAKGELSLKTSGGFKVFGNGATVEGVISGAVQVGYDKRKAKQLGEEFGLLKNQQKAYVETLNKQSSYQESLDYVKKTGININRDLIDEMFTNMRTNGVAEDKIKELANNKELQAIEAQKYAFSKFGIEKPNTYKEYKIGIKQMQNSWNNLSFDSEYRNRLNNKND